MNHNSINKICASRAPFFAFDFMPRMDLVLLRRVWVCLLICLIIYHYMNTAAIYNGFIYQLVRNDLNFIQNARNNSNETRKKKAITPFLSVFPITRSKSDQYSVSSISRKKSIVTSRYTEPYTNCFV